jgi:hypothetical protein
MASHHGFEEGSRATWLEIFRYSLRGLGRGSPEWDVAKLIIERERAINALRMACYVHGDNNWESSANLADIINEHLVRHLRAKIHE